MKIGTITTHMADNYGAVLQAYALSTYINKFSPCEIINYFPEYAREKYGLKRQIKSIKSIPYSIYDSFHLQERRIRKERFSAFRKDYLNLSPEINTTSELRNISSDYKKIIAGSDQIWNPLLHKFDSNYFLTFCAEGVSKYGYAPSFGISKLNNKQKKIVKLRCEGFKDVAFREKSGVQIAEDLFNKRFRCVLDPVFLLDNDDWLKLLPDVAPAKPYYLCYYLSDPRNSIKHVVNMGKKDGFDVISIGYSIKDFANSAKKIYDLGPLEFLAYIYHAECIYTDSFHATAFSIIFNKPFYTRIDGKNAKRSDRIISLIDSVGLTDRSYAEKNLRLLDNKRLDYQNARVQLQRYVADSRDYIEGIINGSSDEVKVECGIYKDIEAFCGYETDVNRLKESSSGGFASAMARAIIQENGIVYGVAYSKDYRKTEYVRIDSLADIGRITGSKYLKSSGIVKDLVAKIQKDLKEGKQVLFIGLPCEVSALLSTLELSDDTENLLTVDLVCHGPTYEKVQTAFINNLEKKYHGKIVDFSVRFKNPYWMPPYVRATFDNGKVYIKEFNHTDFGYAFAHMPLKGCLGCTIKGPRHKADITLGDCWGISKESEAYNKSGVSMAIVRSKKGKEFLQSIKTINLFSADKREMIEHNLNYAFPVDKPNDYDSFCQDIDSLGLHGACLKHASFKKKITLLIPSKAFLRIRKRG